MVGIWQRQMGIGVMAACALGLGIGYARPLWADSWDRSKPSDGTTATRNELVHGTDQLHDLQSKGGTGDEDWYRIGQRPYTSYEILVEATAGEVGAPVVERVDADGTTVVQTSVGVGTVGFARSLRWRNGVAAVDDQYVRVRSGACVKCKKGAGYRIRAFETTYRLTRFNNAGTQVTVILLQNPGTATVAGELYYWLADGSLVATQAVTVGPGAVAVLASQVVVPGVSGSVTLAHDGPFGELTGKAVGLEPATGFSFDTPFEPRPK